MQVDSKGTIPTDKFQIPASTHIDGIHLRVSDLNASLKFYMEIVGFREVERSKTSARLEGHGEHVSGIQLTQSSDTPVRAPRSAGLFHVAFRYPDRKGLSAALWRILKAKHPMTGAADHLVSDALYLEDPDKNGVELYCDQAREAWPREFGELAMGTEPLDIDALLEVADRSTWSFAKKQVDIGHVHLQVTDLLRSEQFYCGVLGFDVTQRSFEGALFVSAGGYHHHIGMNIWNTRGGKPADDSTLGMVSYAIRLGNRESLVALHQRVGPFMNPAATASAGATLSLLDPDRIGVMINA